MAKLPGFPEATFAAQQRIRETALIRYDSLFTPERKLWSLGNLRQFHTLFVGRFDKGEGSFLEKWKKQLDGAGDDIFQLAAELLYVQQFFAKVTGPEKKIENVRAVLAWCTQPVSIPDWAVEGVSRGHSRDMSFNQHRPFHLAWLTEYLIHWHGLPEAERSILLNDPWRFAQDVRAVESSRGAYQSMQEAWLYIAFPDTFENMSSRLHKQRIRDAFVDRLQSGPSSNIDLDLFAIRQSLTSQYGKEFHHFYQSPIIEQWQQANITERDIDLIKQSRLSEKYADFSVEQRGAYKRVHEALRQLGAIALEELGGRDYVLKLTSGFHPNSGVRGNKPKDLWFGVYRKENEERFLGNPQNFYDRFKSGSRVGFLANRTP